jgi:hypothetical protein
MQPDCYVTGHEYSNVIGKAFAQGCNGRLRTVHDEQKNGLACFYGILRGAGEIARHRWVSGARFLYIDHGYIKPGHYGGYYRVVRDDLHTHLLDGPDFGRLLSLGWKAESEHRSIQYSPILVAPPSEYVCRFFGFEREAWLTQIQSQIRRVSERPIVVTSKEDTPAFEILAKAHCLVTLQSNVAVEAVRLGVPVFVVKANAPRRWWHPVEAFGNLDLADLETPYLPSVEERTEWAARLAACQWTLLEINSGLCWTSLSKRTS